MKKKNNDDVNSQTNKISKLEENNENLQEKLKLLRIQLMSQSQLQLASLSHSRSASLNRSQTNLHSSYNFHSAIGLKTRDHAKLSPRKHPESIFHQLSMLQEELDSVREQHKNRIAELEKQIANQNSISSTKLKLELNENVELIKLKRLSKKQSADILSLQTQLELSSTELRQLQNNLLSVTNDKDHLQTELSKEKCENTKLQSDISTLKENTKFLENQINDLQKEKCTLKEHNENLLKLSLQQKSVSPDYSKPNFLKQIKELQDSLQKEIRAKTDLSSKLLDAESSLVKYKYEFEENNLLISELQATNLSIKNEVERMKNLLKNDLSSTNFGETKSVSTQDKSVMVVISDESINFSSINADTNFIIFNPNQDENDREDCKTKIQLYNVSRELIQCKELLRVQYGLNNKYRKEVEELQKMFQKNDKLSFENLRTFQQILRKHEENLSKIKNCRFKEHLKSILAELNRIFSVKKLGSYQDYIHCIEKLLGAHVLFVEQSVINYNSHSSPVEKKVAVVNNSNNAVEEIGLVKQINDFKKLSEPDESPGLVTVQNELDKTEIVIFELRIKNTNFDYFSNHLMKSSGNNPMIFLTWNFLNDNENQAYTPTIPVKERIFDCSCQYEGPWSEFLQQYLKQHGICVEIHLVQEDISVRLAETTIETSSALDHPDELQEFNSKFENDNIKGNVTGTFVLRFNAFIKK